MIWHSPWAFLFLLILVLLVVYTWLYQGRRRSSLRFSSLSIAKKVDPGLRARLAWLPRFLMLAGLILAVIALARPQRADETVTRNVDGIDIMITLDISDSMLIEDMPPYENRMVMARETMKDFIRMRRHDRIGLIVFAGESFTRVPLTLDYDLLLAEADRVDTSRVVRPGTALGVALVNAVMRLRDSTAEERVILFLTDGENNSGTIDPETALEIAVEEGVRIYSVGIGRDGDTRIPVYTTDAFGNRIKRYQPFYSAINEDLLTRMADRTGGRFFRAIDGFDMQSIYEEINRLESSDIEEIVYTRYAELFPPYLQWGVLLYLLGLLLGQFGLGRRP